MHAWAVEAVRTISIRAGELKQRNADRVEFDLPPNLKVLLQRRPEGHVVVAVSGNEQFVEALQDQIRLRHDVARHEHTEGRLVFVMSV